MNSLTPKNEGDIIKCTMPINKERRENRNKRAVSYPTNGWQIRVFHRSMKV